jgi:hypothetical protein
MNTIKIEAKEDTPMIVFDPENNIFEISGRSLPEDASLFYEPILEWLKEYAKSPNELTELHIKMNYFNTASSKLLLDILMIIEEIVEEGHKCNIKWFYAEDDEDMEEAGEEYSELIDVPFELICM